MFYSSTTDSFVIQREVESGSSANGRYVRYADGTMICESRRNGTARGGANTIQYAWTYPSAFTGTIPTVTVTLDADSVYAAGWNVTDMYTIMAQAVNNTGAVGYMTPLGQSTASNYTVTVADMVAVGRWY
ncbi:hypothetical protein D3C78_1300690 [compost metagenome]